ncbi:MAG: PGF-pre-PGF domain-containing protein [Candidatus Hodarchaeaceae archaeon]|nr:PGF-pre-PGF domain-containing protein [Candidatus Hodarchaeaceae archaeon]
MNFKTASLAVCGFLFISLAAGALSSAQTETAMPSTMPIQLAAPYLGGYQMENFSLDLLLEFKSTGRCRIRADYSGPNPILCALRATPVPPKVVTPLTAVADGMVYDYDPSAYLENYKNGAVSITVQMVSGELRNIGDPAYGGTTVMVSNPRTGFRGSVTFDNTDGWGGLMEKSTDIQYWGTGDANKITMKVSMFTDSQGRLSVGSSIRILLQPFGETDAHAQASQRMAKSAAWDEADIINITITGRDSLSLTGYNGAYLRGFSWSEGFAASSASPDSISASPAQPVRWDISVELTSPSEGKLTVTASGWAVLPLTAEQKRMVALAVVGYKLAPGNLNQRMLQQIQDQLKYAPFNVTDLNITRLDWDDAASKLTFGVTVTVESPRITSDVRRELPASITTTGSGSIPGTVKTPEDLQELALDFMFRVVARTAMAELQMKLAGLDSTIKFEYEFELRPDTIGFVTRTENTIIVDFSALKGYVPPPHVLPKLPENAKLNFKLKVPSGADVKNLPVDYTATDSSYTWTDQSALDAIIALITGEAGTRISYWVGPAFVKVENIQEHVGKTIVVENNYVESVEVKTEREIAVNFEKDQPIRRARIALAAGVQNIEKVQQRRLYEKPPEVVAEPPAERGIVCYYLEMKTAAPEQVENATIEFQVPQLWVRVNRIDKASIRLLRYQGGQWVELKTAKITEDENNVYFSAETTGFSFFAVTGAQLPTPPFVEPPPFWVIVVTAIALVAVLIAVVWRYLSRGGKLPEKV